MSHDEFHLRHAGEIRESLIAMEGDSGGFELLSHGFLPEHDGTNPVLYAVVRCCDSGRVHVLANLPKPRQSVTVTVGGLPATVDFIGIPSGLVGVTQINFHIPDGAPAGEQPVVVTVGATQSNTAKIVVQ